MLESSLRSEEDIPGAKNPCGSVEQHSKKLFPSKHMLFRIYRC